MTDSKGGDGAFIYPEGRTPEALQEEIDAANERIRDRAADVDARVGKLLELADTIHRELVEYQQWKATEILNREHLEGARDKAIWEIYEKARAQRLEPCRFCGSPQTGAGDDCSGSGGYGGRDPGYSGGVSETESTSRDKAGFKGKAD